MRTDPSDTPRSNVDIVDLYHEIAENSGLYFEHDENGKIRFSVTSDYDRILTLQRIEAFVRYLALNGSPPYSKVTGRWLARASKSKLNTFATMPQFFDVYEPDRFYTPHVECFFESVNELGYPGPLFTNPNISLSEGRTLGDWYNTLISRIHERTNSRDFKEKVRKHFSRIDRNYLVANQYVNDLFRCYSKLLVIRLELKYRPYIAQHQPNMHDRAAKDLKSFKRGMRPSAHHSVFRDLVGYIQVDEFGAKGTGHHSHLVMFFNGSRRQHDWHIARRIGAHWEKITRGDGLWNSTNRDRKAVHKPNYGIGMVLRTDKRKRTALQEHVIGYLFKAEQILRMRGSAKSKTFSKGELLPDCRRRLCNKVHQWKPNPL